jgi:regulatory protein
MWPTKLSGTSKTPPTPKEGHTPLQDALTLLSKRDYAAATLASKLRKLGHPAAEVASTITECHTKGYLNDQRFALSRLHTRVERSKWGPGKVLQELKEHQVASQPGVAEAVAETDWLTQATQLVQKKYPKPLPSDAKARQQEKARRLGFLQRRGFTMQQALAATNGACQADALEDNDR